MRITSSVLVVIALALVAVAAAGEGRLVGGRTPVAGVRLNREVQALGRFCVEEYNKSGRLRRPGNVAAAPLRFVAVVEAERQVVAGVKYFLKVETAQGGAKRVFDAEVVVKPWLKSKQLVRFSPSPKP